MAVGTGLRVLRINKEQLAWCAGLLEGEGCFLSTTKVSGTKNKVIKRYPRMSIGITDFDVIHRFRKIIGFGNVVKTKMRKGTPHHYKQLYTWDITGPLAAVLMIKIYNYMGERRQKKIQEIILDYDKDESELISAFKKYRKKVK